MFARGKYNNPCLIFNMDPKVKTVPTLDTSQHLSKKEKKYIYKTTTTILLQ